MATDLPDILRLDQPDSPDRTSDLGNLLAETVRALNYATRGEAPGLEYPADADRLIAALYTATGRMPQLFAQITGFLAGLDSGRLRDDRGREVSAQIALACYHLGAAHGAARDLTEHLHHAQNAISGLSMTEDGDG